MGWTAKEKRDWHDLVAHLDDECPGAGEVCVRRTAVRKFLASSEQVGNTCIICIDRGLSFIEAIDALLHEFAHWLEGIRGGNYNEMADHNDAWGVAYATAYRSYLRWKREE